TRSTRDWSSDVCSSDLERDGRRYNIVITPDKACVVNEGLASVRGGGQAPTLFSPDRPTRARLSKPLIARGGQHVPVAWDAAVDLDRKSTRLNSSHAWIS